MSWMEMVATALGVLCVILGVRRSVWTFPAGIVSVALVGWVVWRERLYSDALLQVFFVGANLYGWIKWQRAQAATGDVPVRSMRPGERWGWLIAAPLATAGWGSIMHVWFAAAYPWWDAGTAVVSLIAQLLMAQRKWENWILWVAVDVALIPLYLAKGLTMFATLYVLYLALSIWGLIGWRRALGQAARRAEPVAA